jgi:hypothetical protein
MVRSEQSNGNTQVNSTRDSYNNKVSKLNMLGSTKRLEWEGKRRHRSI